MPTGVMDIHAGLYGLWSASELEWACKSHWSESARDKFMSLGDTTVAPGTPMPYVVYELAEPATITRMTGYERGFKKINQRYLLRFTIHSQQVEDGSRSAKRIAADISDAIKQVFGGHPAVKPQAFQCQYSHVLNCQFESDFGAAPDETNYKHVITYRLTVDTTVAV